MTKDYQALYQDLFKNRLVKFQNLIQIRNAESLINPYYESQFPLAIHECTNTPQNPQSQYTLSLFAPGHSFQAEFGEEFFIDASNVQHQQNYCTLTVVTKGDLYKVISGKRILYPAGSCFLLNRGTKHTECFDTEYQTLNLAIQPEFISGLQQPKSGFMFPNEAVSSGVLYEFIAQKNEADTSPQDYISFTQVLNTQSPIEPLLRQMIEVMTTGGAGATYHLQFLFCLLFSYLEDPTYFHINHFKLKGDSSTVIFSRITHLLEDSNGRVTREEMEQLLKYDGAYLSRIVKKHTGMSLTDYRLSFRMEAAKNKLRFTDMGISEILQELGCTNRTFFSRTFKRRYGMTPAEYRKKHRG